MKFAMMLLFIGGSVATAKQLVVMVPMKGKIVRQEMLPLKRLVKDKYPSLDLSDARVKAVHLFVKARERRNAIVLRVGGQRADSVRNVDGMYEFSNNRFQSYDRVILKTKGIQGRRVALELKGVFKFHAVSLIIDKPVGFSDSMMVFNGNSRRQKIGIHTSKIKRIRLTARGQGVNIGAVIAIAGNGDRIRLPVYDGYLRGGDSTVVILDRKRHISELIVRAQPIGRRGALKVKAIQQGHRQQGRF